MRRTPKVGRPVRGSKTGRPVMALLDLLGRRWLLRVVWELRAGPLTFRALRAACADVSPTVLNDRLRELRETRFVVSTDEGYELSPLGRELLRDLAPVARFAERWARSLET